jgi:hypothetical protein
MTSASDAQKTAENQARKALEATRHEERFQAIKRAEEEQIEARTMKLPEVYRQRDLPAAANCGRGRREDVRSVGSGGFRAGGHQHGGGVNVLEV